MSITNATRLSDFAAGIGTEGAILKIDNANQRIGIGTQFPNQMLQVAGIVSATQFIGDGSQLEGITSAGLGTAIDETEGSVGAVIYYTDDLLTVTETTTVNPPASASAAYTQYRDVKLNDSVDLIIETGDDFIPDVLGLGTDASDPTLSGNGVFDEVYTNIIKNKNGLGAPAFANGLTSVGVITATGGFSGNVTGDVTGNVNNSSNLILKTDNAERLRIDSNGKLLVGGTSTDSSGLISIVKDTTEVLADNEPLYNNASPAFLTVYNSNNTGSGEEAGINIVPAGSANGAISIYGKKTGSYAGDLIFRFRSGASTSAERLRISNTGAFGIGGANYGTSGQVLTSQGSGSAVQWATPSAGAWSKLTSGTFSSSDGVLKEITSTHLTSAHIMYKLYMEFTMSATNFEVGLNVKANGVWEESNYDYNLVGSRDGAAYDASRSSQTRIHFGEDNHYSSFYSVEGFFANVHSTTQRKIFKLSGVCNNDLTGYSGKSTWSQMGGYNSNDAVTGIRIKATKQVSGSGTFDYGWYLLEGYAP